MSAMPPKEKQSSVAALHINILGRMHWDSEMVIVKHLKYVFGSKKGTLLTVSMLGSPKPPGSNMLLGSMESSLLSAAVAECELSMCKQPFCDYRILLICTGTNNS